MLKSLLNKISNNSQLLITFLATTVFAFYNKNMEGYWRWDDTQILLHSLHYSPWEYFFIPDVWQRLSPYNLTPWISLSFDIDIFLFGLKPFGFYLHHLISLFLVSTASYLLLSLWVAKHWAFIGSLLFLLGAPVETVTHQLMTRHYIEGLFFSITALYCFTVFLRRENYSYLVIAVFFYILSVTAKEIYVPLVIILLFMVKQKSTCKFRRICAYITPFIIVAIIYVIWRYYMLITILGGYVESSDYLSSSYWQYVINNVGRIPELLAGKYWFLFFGIYFAFMLYYFFIFRNKLMISLLSTFLILTPLIPLAKWPGILSPDRYLLLFWYITSFSFTFFISQCYLAIKTKYNKYCLPLYISAWFMMFSIIFVYSRNIAESLDAIAKEIDIQMNFAWAHDTTYSFVPTKVLTGSLWTLGGLYEIKKILNKNGSSPIIVVDDIFINEKNNLFEYDIQCQCMKDISNQIQKTIEHFKEITHYNASLSIFATNYKGIFSWKYGPYITGEYRIVSKSIGSYHMPITGSIPFSIKVPMSFYLLYISPEGWQTYSQELTLYPDGSPLNWKRHTN